MSMYYVPSTPPPFRGRAQSFSHSMPYGTPYSPYNALPGTPYGGGFGVARSAPYYVAPTVAVRGRSHSRPRHHTHHRSGHHQTHRRSRSHSAVPHRHSRPSGHQSYRYQTGATSSHYPYHSPSLGSRILKFFGLGGSDRYVDQHGRSDGRGRSKYKY